MLEPEKPFRIFKRFLHCKIEELKVLKNKNKINLIYDFNISPPTYGDCIDSIFLIRLISSLGKKVGFKFIKDSYRKDWDYLNKNDFANELINVASHLLPKKCQLNVYSEKDDLYISNNSNTHNLFFNQIPFFRNNQIPVTYVKAMDLAFMLFKYCSNQQFLLDKYTLQNVSDDFINKEKYVTIPLRYNTKTAQSRNIGTLALDIIDLISNSLDAKVMIISDLEGCYFYKKILSEKFKKNIFYCKDFSKSFIEDVEIILKSSFYLQYFGGGMLTIARISTIPYLICNKYANHEFFLKKNYKFPWSNEKQKYILSDEFAVFMDALDNSIPLIKDSLS